MSRPSSPRMRKVNELLREVIAEAVTELRILVSASSPSPVLTPHPT